MIHPIWLWVFAILLGLIIGSILIGIAFGIYYLITRAITKKRLSNLSKDDEIFKNLGKLQIDAREVQENERTQFEKFRQFEKLRRYAVGNIGFKNEVGTNARDNKQQGGINLQDKTIKPSSDITGKPNKSIRLD